MRLGRTLVPLGLKYTHFVGNGRGLLCSHQMKERLIQYFRDYDLGITEIGKLRLDLQKGTISRTSYFKAAYFCNTMHNLNQICVLYMGGIAAS